MDNICYAALLFSLTSLVSTSLVIGVLSVQKVYAHLKAVKRLLMEFFLAFIGFDLVMFLRSSFPLDEATTVLAARCMFSLWLYAVAAIGVAATILYVRPRSTSWKDMYRDVLKKMFLPFVSYMTIIFIIFVVTWTLPLNMELRACPLSGIEMYVPVVDTPHLIILSISFIAFIIYPTTVFLLASKAANDEVVSSNLKMFAICIVGTALSMLLQPYFFSRLYSAGVNIIRIPCFLLLTYVFRKNTILQSFYSVELREYVEELRAIA